MKSKVVRLISSGLFLCVVLTMALANSIQTVIAECAWSIQAWTYENVANNDPLPLDITFYCEKGIKYCELCDKDGFLIKSESVNCAKKFVFWDAVPVPRADFPIHLLIQCCPDGELHARTYKLANVTIHNVGGIAVPVDKSALLTSYVGLTSTILVATAASVICVKWVRRRTENQ